MFFLSSRDPFEGNTLPRRGKKDSRARHVAQEILFVASTKFMPVKEHTRGQHRLRRIICEFFSLSYIIAYVFRHVQLVTKVYVHSMTLQCCTKGRRILKKLADNEF